MIFSLRNSSCHFIKKVVLVTVAFLIPALASAGTVVCSGKVAYLGVNQFGIVGAYLTGMNVQVQLCNLNSDWVVAGSLEGNTSVAACKAIYATLVAGKIADRSFDWIMDGTALPATCTSFVGWANVNLRWYAIN
jgi:hypothetical protein